MDQSLSTKPRVCFEVEKVIGVASDGNVRSYQVQWAPAWVSSFHLVGCEHLIQEFLQRQAVVDDVQKSKQLQPKESNRTQLHNMGEGLVSSQSSIHMSETLTQSNDNCKATDLNMIYNLPHEYENEAFNMENDSNLVKSSSSSLPEKYTMSTDDLDIKIEDEDTGDSTDNNINAYQIDVGIDILENSAIMDTVETSIATYVTDNHNSKTWSSREKTVHNKSCATTHLVYSTKDDLLTEQTSNKQSYLNLDTDSIKKHNCVVCWKQFTCPSGLKIHMRTHTGDRPYMCEYCHRGFTQNGDLQRHLRMHAGVKPFICDVCGKGFTRNSNMKHHRALAHK